LLQYREYDRRTAAPLPKSSPRIYFALAVLTATAAGFGVWLGVRDGGNAVPVQPKDDPVVFLRGIVLGIASNDYQAVWPSLHPAQQRIATRRVYVRCELRDPVAGRLDGIEVVKALNERIVVAGAGGDLVDSKAVTFRLQLFESTGETFSLVTAHAVAVDGQWRWILRPSRFEVYRSGACPVTAPPPQRA
jgi:hypothetical protein